MSETIDEKQLSAIEQQADGLYLCVRLADEWRGGMASPEERYGRAYDLPSVRALIAEVRRLRGALALQKFTDSEVEEILADSEEDHVNAAAAENEIDRLRAALREACARWETCATCYDSSEAEGGYEIEAERARIAELRKLIEP